MNSDELSFYLFIALMSMAICMAIIPVMMKIAPSIGMIDRPDTRKVHAASIPRSGGIGIVLGIIIPLALWLDFSPFSISLILGCSVLLIFGAWDDAKNIRPLYKFSGQFLAALIAVYYGDIYVIHFPFIGLESIPDYIGRPFTVIAIVGMINALNLSDGLDGLAGGEALLSLAAIVYLSYQFDGFSASAVAAATIGGIFGFLRFNSHPARIFMGDAGSQTLGFILALLVVYLTQQVNSLISPVTALLLLGLPVIDSFVVFFLRARRGDSLVVAAKDHLHHRLLGIGYYHYESVVIIYSIQVILIICAALLPYESDILLLGVYIGLSVLVFLSVTVAEKNGWRARSSGKVSGASSSDVIGKFKFLSAPINRFLEASLSFFIAAAALMSGDIPVDLGVTSLVLLVLLIVVLMFGRLGDYLYRLVLFVTIGFSVYLLSTSPPEWLLQQSNIIYLFFMMITIAVFIMVRLSNADQFQVSPLDYLVLIIVVSVSMAPGIQNGSSSLIWMVVQMVILFYACELVIQAMKSRLNSFTGAAILALTLISYRSLI